MGAASLFLGNVHTPPPRAARLHPPLHSIPRSRCLPPQPPTPPCTLQPTRKDAQLLPLAEALVEAGYRPAVYEQVEVLRFSQKEDEDEPEDEEGPEDEECLSHLCERFDPAAEDEGLDLAGMNRWGSAGRGRAQARDQCRRAEMGLLGQRQARTVLGWRGGNAYARAQLAGHAAAVHLRPRRCGAGAG